MAKEVPDESPTCFLPEILNRLNSWLCLLVLWLPWSHRHPCVQHIVQWLPIDFSSQLQPLQPLQPFHTCDSRFTWLLRLSLLSFDPPEIDWDDIGIFARSLLKRCFAALYCLGDSRICENPYVWPVPHIWELGICVGPVPQLWQMLRCRRSLDPLYNCYFGFKILWDVWSRKLGVSNTAQTKNTRNEQFFCWLW